MESCCVDQVQQVGEQALLEFDPVGRRLNAAKIIDRERWLQPGQHVDTGILCEDSRFVFAIGIAK